MDFSGIGMALISCIFMILVPPVIAGIIFVPVFLIKKFGKNGSQMTGYQAYVLFLILYLIAFVGSCFFSYFVLLRNMYVM